MSDKNAGDVVDRKAALSGALISAPECPDPPCRPAGPTASIDDDIPDDQLRTRVKSQIEKLGIKNPRINAALTSAAVRGQQATTKAVDFAQRAATRAAQLSKRGGS